MPRTEVFGEESRSRLVDVSIIVQYSASVVPGSSM